VVLETGSASNVLSFSGVVGGSELSHFMNFSFFPPWHSGFGPVPPPQLRVVLVAHILNVYCPANKAPNFAITSGPQKSTLPGSRVLTPAFVVSTLGHEMIYMGQYNRKYKTNFNGINDAVAALRELEAYNWQLRKGHSPRTFKVDSLFSSFQNSEQHETELNFQCAQWDFSNAIENSVRVRGA
jgi:hypothetical protein